MARSRSRPRARRDARFLWQVLLVVPPVVILSLVALYSLRQDRASIEQDARRNAGALAAELARRFSERIHDDLAAAATAQITGSLIPAPAASRGSSAAQTDTAPAADSATLQPLCGLILNGEIRLPADYPPLPSPPAWLYTLSSSQAQNWRAAADATPQSDLAGIRRAVAALVNAPFPVRANAEWCLTRAETAQDGTSSAVQRLTDLAARYPDVPSESGTPLADLALLLALRLAPDGKPPDSLVLALRTRMLAYPSFMTSALVDEMVRRAAGDPSVTALDARWRANERALSLLRGLPVVALSPGEILLELGGEAWLALIAALQAPTLDAAEAPGSALHVTLVPARRIERVFRSAVAEAAARIPGYASVSVRVGDSVWHGAETAPPGDRSAELASVSGRFELSLLVPSDAVPTFAADLLRIAPQALPAASSPPEGAVRLTVPPGGHAFTISVDLVAPDALYASYRRRFWLAMGLILAATVAALGGLASTWRAFQRQRRLSEMKSNFVASVSHELRAPIAAVRLMTESLERGTVEGGDRQQEYLKAIGQECRRLSSLVDNVLDFSRIDRGSARYTFEPADVRALVAQTVELMRPCAALRQIALVDATSPPQGDERFEQRIDRQALQQALVNLIDNAIKHSPAGADVTVGIEGEPDRPRGAEAAGAHAGAGVRLFVEDHGPGIPLDEQERIFEPFYRRGSELRRETPGIGIGLSIVKHIAEAHGGRVVVRSSPGAGSRFTIELPATTESEP